MCFDSISEEMVGSGLTTTRTRQWLKRGCILECFNHDNVRCVVHIFGFDNYLLALILAVLALIPCCCYDVCILGRAGAGLPTE